VIDLIHLIAASIALPSEEETLTVPSSLFDGFDYVALGHLHEPQQAGGERVCYAGSLLKYSFNEAAQRKSVTLVDIDLDRSLQTRDVQLPVRRDVVRLRGLFAELLAAPQLTAAEAYVEVVLTDPEPVLDPVTKLREVYPHLLSLRREGSSGVGPASSGEAIGSRSTLDLFGEFFSDVTGLALSDGQGDVLTEVLNDVERDEREAGAA